MFLLYKEGLNKPNLLILTCLLLIASTLSSFASWYCTMKYHKTESKVKFVNKALISVIVISQIISIVLSICAVLAYMFVFTNDLSLTKKLLTSFLITSAISSFFWFIIVLFFSSSVWFYIDENEKKLVTIGEKINLEKIVKIIEDDEKSAIYINYLEGKKSLKKIKFYKKSLIGMYFLENVNATGCEIEKANQQEFFKKEISKIRQETISSSINQKNNLQEEKKEDDNSSNDSE